MVWHFDILKQRENVALFLCIDILLTFPTCTKSFTMCLVNSSTKLPQRLLYLSSEGIYEGYCQLNVCGKQIWAGGRDTALMRATILQRSCSRCPVELAHCDIDVHCTLIFTIFVCETDLYIWKIHLLLVPSMC